MFKIINDLKNRLWHNRFIGHYLTNLQKRLDYRLVYKLNNKKIPNFRQLTKLPTVLVAGEKMIIWTLTALLIISSTIWSWRFYQRHLTISPKANGEYTEGLIGFPSYINPLLQISDADRSLSYLIFSGLLRRDKNQQLVPDLAENYEISDDQKTYTFKLRRDVIWHDGEKFTSNDVAFTIESIQKPEFKSPLNISFNGIEIEVIDDYIIKFILPEPYSPFLNLLTVGILPEHLWSNIEPNTAPLASYNLEPIGTGRWQFSKLTSDKNTGLIKSIELKRFNQYYQTKSYLEKIIFKFYPDSNQAIDALKNKNIQGLEFVSDSDKNKVEQLKNVVIKNLSVPQYTAIFLNQKNNNALRDINVRKAIAISIDRLALIKQINSTGQPIYGPILPDFIGYNAELGKTEFNFDEANKILDDNKWKRVTAEELISSKKIELTKKLQTLEKQLSDNQKTINRVSNTANNTEELEQEKNKITTEITELDQLKTQDFYRQNADILLQIQLTTIDRPENILTAEAIKKWWAQIGIKTEIKITDKTKVQKDIIKPRLYEALLFSESIGSDPDPYPFWHSSQNQDPGLNLALFTNKDADKLLEEARQTANQEIRSDKYLKFQEILVKEMPAIFLYQSTYNYPFYIKINNFNVKRLITPVDRFANIEEWYLNTTGKFTW